MKLKLITFIGWFGILTPVFVAGFVVGWLMLGLVGIEMALLAILLSFINYKLGRRVLNVRDMAKGKKYGKQ